MSLECGECENSLRVGHAPGCSQATRRSRKPGSRQYAALRAVKTWGPIYMPVATEERLFESVARRGLLVWRRVEDGHKYNGYALTDAGIDALTQEQPNG